MNSTSSLGLIALSCGLAFFFAKPLWADITALNTQKAEYASALESFKSIESIKASLKQKLDQLSPEERTRIETLLPEKPDTVKLVADLSSIAARHSISIDTVSFAQSVGDAGGSVATAAPLPYMSLTVSFSFVSTYQNLKNFLADVETSLRLVDIHTINVGAGEKGTATYKVSADIYWLPPVDTKTQ